MPLREAIKSALPPVMRRGAGKFLRQVRKTVRLPAQHIRAWRAPRLHDRLLASHRGVHPIRVMFLMSNTASWKVGPVFAQMMSDPEFEPIVVVCPNTNGHLSTTSDHTADLACRYLETEGFAYIDLNGKSEVEGRIEIQKIDPHLVFFTNPHRLVPKYLHDELLTSRLTCYVPYHHEVMEYGSNQDQYNKDSHNAFWRVFVPHEESRQSFKKTRIRSDTGVIVSGFPACETFLAPALPREPSPWKPQEKPKLRIIYAPHWLWNSDIKMATIDTYGEAMMRLAEKHCADVQWALRPHPMLKPKLMKESEWGPQRTEDFFAFWKRSDFCQIHEEDYVPLFKTSDAIIHDSGSFLAEYLYLKKPVLYLMTEQTGDKYFSSFGRRAIKSCSIGRSVDDIERFLDKMLDKGAENQNYDNSFFKQDIAPLFQTPPSIKICHEIKRAFS